MTLTCHDVMKFFVKTIRKYRCNSVVLKMLNNGICMRNERWAKSIEREISLFTKPKKHVIIEKKCKDVDFVNFELLKKLIQCGIIVSSFGKKESSFGLENSSITIRNDSQRSTIMIEFFDEDAVTYRYKLLGDISKHKNREIKIIDYFVESLKENPQALKKFQREINALAKENNDADKAIKLVRAESWGFVHKKIESCFMIDDVSVSYKNWGKASSCFSVLTKNYHDFPKYLSVDSYKVSNPSDESITNAFIFSLKYQRSANSILKFLRQTVCDRSEKWVQKKGM